MTGTKNLTALKGDVFGGLTAAVVALPLALAFGVQSGMGAIAGLYGAIAIGIVAAWLGGTPTQISGPTGPMTVVSAVVVADAVARAGGLDEALPVILGVFLLAGALQIALGACRIGDLISYMPYPVVSGFMSGIGVIIIILQLFPFLGHPSPKRIPEIFSSLPGILSQTNYASVGLALVTIGTIYLFPLISRAIPSALVALIVLTIASTILGLNVAIIGEIPTGLPKLNLEAFASLELSHAQLIIVPALTLAALGAIDSLLTSVVADNLTKTQHKSNRELFGQGLGNMAAALIGGIPGAGATMRTVVNIKSGGVSRLSGVIHGFILLIVLLGAGAYARLIPLPVLAGILVTVGIGIIDYKGLRHMTHVPRTDAIIMLIVLGVTVFVDLLQAVAIGMVMASVLFMKKMSEIVENSSGITSIREFVPNDSAWSDESKIPASIADKIYIKHLEGPIFFGFASALERMADLYSDVEIVIIRMRRVPYIDQTGLYSIENVVQSMNRRGIVVLITGIVGQPLTMLESVDLIPDLIPNEHVFDDFSDCIDMLEKGLVYLAPANRNEEISLRDLFKFR